MNKIELLIFHIGVSSEIFVLGINVLRDENAYYEQINMRHKLR